MSTGARKGGSLRCKYSRICSTANLPYLRDRRLRRLPPSVAGRTSDQIAHRDRRLTVGGGHERGVDVQSGEGLVAETAGDGTNVDAGGEELGGDVVPQVVKPRRLEPGPLRGASDGASGDIRSPWSL